jgi:NAD(P)-dependent dehydrogenase (short-subunit alcohol dehydrogenase family)
MKKSVLITGVSTGIGYHLLKIYYEKGYLVFGSVRNSKDRDRLLKKFPDFKPLIFDVTDDAAIKTAIEEVAQVLDGRGLDLLINNAGVAFSGPLMLIDMEEMHRQFDINLFGVVRVTQACLPLLGATQDPTHPPGRIINMSSVSGQVGFPYLGPYVSSKHALEGLSHCLRRELLHLGIDVVIIGPGSIKTPIWEKESATEIPEKYNRSPFGKYVRNFQKVMLRTGERGMDPYLFAQKVAAISEKKRPKTRYAIAKNYFSDWFLIRYILPDRIFDQGIIRMLGK